jgi:hypothetical protein
MKIKHFDLYMGYLISTAGYARARKKLGHYSEVPSRYHLLGQLNGLLTLGSRELMCVLLTAI